MIKVDGSVAIINIKNFPIDLHVMYLYFPDTPRSYKRSVDKISVLHMKEYIITTNIKKYNVKGIL